MIQVAVIGGGAAGFFAAITCAQKNPDALVTIFEKSSKLLAKVKVSGGGRCNVTNACTDIPELSKAYPRGQKQLKKAFHSFSTKDTMAWFEARGVPLMVQEDQCVFPVSQDSQSIIDCFMWEVQKLGIQIITRAGVQKLEKKGAHWFLHFNKEVRPKERFDQVIVATGGSPTLRGLEWFRALDHTIENPVPSLFTFNMPDESVRELMGVVVEPALVSIPGTKLKGDGPLLITHWGMSGPAILKLSAFGARYLSEQDYRFQVKVNWVNTVNEETVMQVLENLVAQHPHKALANFRPYGLPKRLWNYLLERCGLPLQKPWIELGKKSLYKIVNVLTNDLYTVRGKTTFKEEFVTCGGVALENIDFKTMESKVSPGLYFAGEVLDVDGITGGYNFQSAWTTAYIAGHLGKRID